MGLIQQSPSWKPARSADNRAAPTAPRCWSRAPLAKPVVPDVYWICTGSVDATGGSGAPGDPLAQNASQSLKLTTSRNAGRSGRTSATSAASDTPR